MTLFFHNRVKKRGGGIENNQRNWKNVFFIGDSFVLFDNGNLSFCHSHLTRTDYFDYRDLHDINADFWNNEIFWQ